MIFVAIEENSTLSLSRLLRILPRIQDDETSAQAKVDADLGRDMKSSPQPLADDS